MSGRLIVLTTRLRDLCRAMYVVLGWVSGECREQTALVLLFGPFKLGLSS